jgi:pantothenate kinase
MQRPPDIDPEQIESIDALVAIVRSRHRPGVRTLLGIAGPPGSGKSRLAQFLAAAALPAVAAVVQQDGFHLANEVLVARGRRDAKGAPDTFDVDGFISLLDRLRTDVRLVVYAPAFRRDLEEAINAAVPIGPDVDLVIVEGNYLLLDDRPWHAVAARLDRTLYIDTPEAARRRRLVDRHRRTYGSHEAAAEWVERVDQPNARLVEASRHRADAVVSGLDVPTVGPC